MAVSGTHTGWRYDPDNARLDYYYRGTRVGSINASGQFLPAGKSLVQGMLSFPYTTLTTLTSGATVTYTAAQMLGGYISDTITAACAATTPTATALVAAIPNAVIGTSFLFILKNTAASAISITLTGVSDVTITGTATVAQANTKIWLGMVTAVSTPAVTFYSIGTMVH